MLEKFFDFTIQILPEGDKIQILPEGRIRENCQKFEPFFTISANLAHHLPHKFHQVIRPLNLLVVFGLSFGLTFFCLFFLECGILQSKVERLIAQLAKNSAQGSMTFVELQKQKKSRLSLAVLVFPALVAEKEKFADSAVADFHLMVILIFVPLFSADTPRAHLFLN